MATLFDELKRRGVIRAGLAYLAIAWVILQVFDIVSDILQLPGWLLQLSLIVMIIGFPIVLVLAWLYNITPDSAPGTDEPVATPGIGGRKIDFVIIGALCLVVVFLAIKERIVPPPQESDRVPPTVSNYRRVTESHVIFPPYASPYPLVSGNSRLYVSTIETSKILIKQVAMSGGDLESMLSPDGNSRTIFRPTGALPDDSGMLLTGFAPDTLELLTWKYPFVGGSPQVLGEGADAIYSPDGEQIAYVDRDSNIFVADAEMENARLVAVTNEQRVHWVRWSPDGRRLRYMAMGDPRVIWEVDIDDGEPKRLLPEWEQVNHCCGVWTPDGRYFVFQATRDFKTHLYAMREPDDKNPGARSDPIRITVGPLEYRRPTVAPNGKSLFAIGWQLRGETVILDPATDQLRPLIMSEDLSAEWLSYAANADRMAYVSYPKGNLWTSRTDGSARLQLTFDDFTVFEPDVSPDGQYVEFYGRHGREPDAVFVVSSTGGKPEQISPADEFAYSGGFSPDGKKIVFRVRGKDPILVYDVDRKTTTELPNSNGLHNPHWSPGGKQLFARGRDWLAIYDMASGQTRKILENRPLQNPYWGSDDSTIYVTDLIGFGMGSDLYAVDTDTGAEKFVAALGNNRLVSGQHGSWVGMTPAGEPMFLRDLSIHHIYELDWLP